MRAALMKTTVCVLFTEAFFLALLGVTHADHLPLFMDWWQTKAPIPLPPCKKDTLLLTVTHAAL